MGSSKNESKETSTKMKLILATTFLTTTFALFQELTFKEWKQVHGINFHESEEASRELKFLEAQKFVKSHNARFNKGEETFTVSLNKFAAYTNEEFSKLYLQKPVERKPSLDLTLMYQCPEIYSTVESFPAEYQSPYVTEVKDQGQCGSCWTFGSGAAIEGAFCKAGLYDCSTWSGVSTQQIVDCASSNPDLNPYDDNGCNGGFQPNALRYVMDFAKGIDSWEDYTYKAVQGTCNYDASKSQGTISSCGKLGISGNEDLMCSMIYNKGVTTVSIDASGIAFQLYSGGVYSNTKCSTTQLDHAVTATGYGTMGGQNTLTIKNSWGTSWGVDGYIYFARNGGNTCGAFTEGVYGIMWWKCTKF